MLRAKERIAELITEWSFLPWGSTLLCQLLGGGGKEVTVLDRDSDLGS